MKLYYAPATCALGIHTLLEEIGAPYEAVRLNIPAGEQHRPPFSEINPKSKVPTLVRDDGSVLTEYPAIAFWLAVRYPEAKLMPEDDEAKVRAAETTDYCVATIHMQGFGRILRPGNFAPSESDHETVKAKGREMMEKGLALVDKHLGGKEWVAGRYSYADSALFYVEYWATKRAGIELPANCAAHYARMTARPAVQRMMEQEGLTA